MTKKNMILRICQKRAGVTKKEWDNKTISQSQKDIMREKYNELWDYPNLDIVYIAKPTIEDIKTTIKEKQIE
jgi:vacuolar-type H+-ATPase subunit F/Vma7